MKKALEVQQIINQMFIPPSRNSIPQYVIVIIQLKEAVEFYEILIPINSCKWILLKYQTELDRVLVVSNQMFELVLGANTKVVVVLYYTQLLVW